jgi:hypothetical protein
MFLSPSFIIALLVISLSPFSVINPHRFPNKNLAMARLNDTSNNGNADNGEFPLSAHVSS